MSLPSKVVCVGRNYAEHARELGNDIPELPVLFIKPSSAVSSIDNDISWDQQLGECHHEAELCLRIDQPLVNANLDQVMAAVGAVTLGLDLTLRDVQNELKNKGQPWERSKAFKGSCVLADWVPIADASVLDQLQFKLFVNDQLRQHGDINNMIFSLSTLLVDISKAFGLEAGDVVMTGTPAGVAALQRKDQLKLELNFAGNQHVWQARCAD